MDIYEAILRIAVEVLVVSQGLLSHLVTVPSNAGGPLDNGATLTDAGASFAGDVAGAALHTANILCDMFEALF